MDTVFWIYFAVLGVSLLSFIANVALYRMNSKTKETLPIDTTDIV
jgi:hypothetical protein